MDKLEHIMKRFEIAYGKWVVRNRWLLIIITSIAVFAAFNGLQNLSFKADNRVFFSDDNPQLLALEALENTYDKSNTVLITIAPKSGNVFDRNTLSAVEEMTEAAWQMPYSSRVNSISNFQHTWVNDDDLIVENLVQNAANLLDKDLEKIKKIALSEPELINKLISNDGDVTGIAIYTMLPGKSMMEVPEIASFTRNLAEEFKIKYPHIDYYLTGGVMVDNSFGEVGMNDMSTLIPLMFIGLIIFIGISIKSISGTIGTLIVILASMITGLGFAGWFGMVINAASANAPTIILTLAVADSVHLLVTAFQQIRLGKTKYEAIAESLRINLQPIFLTSITTIIGFLTMNFSDAPPYRDLGNIVAMGVFAAFIFSVTFLPALMAVLPIRIKLQSEKPNDRLTGLANFVIKRRTALTWGIVTIIGIFTIGIAKLELNDNWIKYFKESYQIRIDTDFTESRLTGLDTIEYSLESGEPGGISNPEYLAMVDDFADWYRKQSKVLNVSTITNTIKRLNQNMHSNDKQYYQLPQERSLTAQYLLLYEMSLPFGLDLNNQINVDKSASRMMVTLRGTSTNELRVMEEEAEKWLEDNSGSLLSAKGTGLSLTWAHLSERNINSLLGGTFWALLLISIILIFVFRSFKLGLISLIPNLSPAFIAFGIWGLAVGQAGLGISIIAAMTLGIVVDDTVHFMSKYLRARRELNLEPEEAVRYSFKTVGSAMVITTFALVFGFMVLAFSGFKMNSDMGLMAAMTITIALILDFLLLPGILIWIDAKKQKTTVTNNEENTMINLFKKSRKAFSTTLTVSLLILSFQILQSADNDSPELKGLNIAKEMKHREAGFEDFTTEMTMTLKNKHGHENKRQIRINTLEVNNDGDKSLFVFDSPRDVKGTAFLNHIHKVGGDDQWLYLPALKRVKRISSQNKSGSFMGSEFAYEDFTNQEIEKYTYKWIRDEKLNDKDCFVIEYYPVDKRNTGYSRQLTWIDKNQYTIQKIEFYDRKNSHLKTLTMSKFIQYKNTYWKALDMRMINHQNGKSTVLQFSNYQFSVGLNDADFTKTSLKRVK